MTCEAVRNQMCDFLDGLLAEKEQQEFTQHLADCSMCREEATELQETLSWLKQAEDVAPPSGLRRAVLAELEAEQTAKHRRHRAPGFSHGVAAAAVFFILLAGNVIPLAAPFATQNAMPRSEALSSPQVFEAEEMGALTMDTQDVAGQSYTENTAEEKGESLPAEGYGAADNDSYVRAAESQAVESSGRKGFSYRLVFNLVLIPLFFLLALLALKNRKEATP